MLKRFHGFDNAFELLFGRLLFRGTSLQVHRIGDVEMLVDHRTADAGSIRGCVSTDMYRLLLDKVSLPKDLTVLDVGANAGGFPLLLHALGHRFTKLTCVEMNPATAERLRFNIKSNWSHAEVLNAAAASETGQVMVRLGRGSTSDSLTTGTKDGTGDEVSVNLVKLDDISGDGPIDLLKIDIEGAEQDVLFNPGHEQTMARAQVLVIEIHHEPTAQQVHDVILAQGFEWVASDEEGALIGQHIFARKA